MNEYTNKGDDEMPKSSTRIGVIVSLLLCGFLPVCSGCGDSPNRTVEETDEHSFNEMTNLAREDLEISEESEEE